MTKYQMRTSTRRESRTLVGRFRGGKLAPVMAVALRESESCVLSQSITFELDPIAGQMITPITAEFISVFVPVQAIDAIMYPASATAGNTEVLRDKLLSGTPLMPLMTENEVSKRLGVVPRSVGGVKKVNAGVLYAYNAAINFLRQRKYVNATKVVYDQTGITPALISQTVLDRLNAVLDPEDRVNGAVQLTLPQMQLPVTGIGFAANPVANVAGVAVRTADAADDFVTDGNDRQVGGTTIVDSEGVGAAVRPKIFARLNATTAGNLSLTEFYDAELMDRLTREMRLIVDENPEYGDEIIQRWAHGLSVDMGKTPFVVHQSTAIFGQNMARATDSAGVAADTMRTDLSARISFTVPVPASELGGIVITFACVKPDETIASQPHPILSDVWGAQNYVADEMSRDPVAVTMRELNSEVALADEGTVAFYTGLNELKRAYVNYGFNRHIDLTTVAAKTAIWQLEVPMSVTPDSVLYPATLAHYPFADQNAEVCTYTISSVQTVATPMIFGPTPVEELATIETSNIFGDA